jgi:NADPH2:quinone reductase
MRAIRLHQTGGPDVLRVEELPTPAPGPGEALVRVESVGVNFIEVYERTGAYPRELPFALGSEGAGVVEAVGEGAMGLKAGDRVAWSGVQGSYATHVVAPAGALVPVPEALPLRVAAAAMLQGMTAHYLVHATYPLKAGESCLVHAAAGGVGLLLVQMAKRFGARVFGTTSTVEKAAFAKEAGADDVILYTQEPFDQALRSRTGGRGVDVVFDSVGATTFDQSLLCLRPRGMMVLFGQSSGRVPPFDLQLLNQHGSLFLTRPTLRHYVASRGELLGRAGGVLGAVARGEMKVRIHAELPLERAGDAHGLLASRATSGKVLLVPGA